MEAIDPAHATSRLELRVRFCETDLMGIVHHGNYLAYFEAGRVDWLRKRGVTYATWAGHGRHLPVIEVIVHYRGPARFDDVLTVETRLVELRPASMRFDYVVTRGGALIAEGQTRLACVDDSHKLQRLTSEMLDVLRSPERTVTSTL